ncbi:PAS domain S-box protein [Mangrovibacter sp. SLW1]
MESSADAIIGKDINGKIISWNTGAEKMFGYTREEAMGHYLSDLIIPMRLQNEEVMTLNRVRNKETISDMETVRRRKDGSELQVSGTVSPF